MNLFVGCCVFYGLDGILPSLQKKKVSSEAPGGAGCPATSYKVRMEKWKTLDLQNGSKD